jgi:hypothetical protein
MSGIDNAKKAQGWTHPNERERCANCKHVAVDNYAPGFCKPVYRCAKGSFMTPGNAVCNLHEWVF